MTLTSVSTAYPIELVVWSSTGGYVNAKRRVSKKLRRMAKKARRDFRRGKTEPWPEEN